MAVSRDQMGVSRYFSAVESMLDGTGVRLNGRNPQDIRINDEVFLQRALAQGSLGVGESYMDGQWDCERLDDMLTRVFRAEADRRLPTGRPAAGPHSSRSSSTRRSPSRSFKVGEQHYDVGDDLYVAHARQPHDLYLRLLAERDHARGSAGSQARPRLPQARTQARHEGARHRLRLGRRSAVCGRALRRQRDGRDRSRRTRRPRPSERCTGLPVKILLQDYRSVDGPVRPHLLARHVRARRRPQLPHVLRDRATGCWRRTGCSCCTPSAATGRAAPTIRGSRSTSSRTRCCRRWRRSRAAAEDLFVTEDWHSFGPDYDRTLMQWYNASWPAGRRLHRSTASASGACGSSGC